MEDLPKDPKIAGLPKGVTASFIVCQMAEEEIPPGTFIIRKPITVGEEGRGLLMLRIKRSTKKNDFG